MHSVVPDVRHGVRRVLTAVPEPGTGRDTVWAWVEDPELRSVPLVRLPDLDALVPELQWLRVRRHASFWEESGSPSLSEAMASLLSGLLAGSGAVAIVASTTPSGLAFYLGAGGMAPGALRPAVLACLPGADLVEVDVVRNTGVRTGLTRAHTAHGASVALTGHSAVGDPKSGSSLLERLCATRLPDWSLTVLMYPAPRDAVVERYARLAHLRMAFAAEVNRSVVVDDVTTADLDDPVLRELLDGIELEQDRCRTATRSGGGVAAVVLSAPDAAVLEALAAVAVASTPTASDGSRPGWRAMGCPDGWVPGGFVTCDEASYVVRPPLHDVHGLPCRAWARFDEHPEPFVADGPLVRLGVTASGLAMEVPAGALLTHALITGNTGVGKSTFLFSLLEALHAAGLSYLVIEPAKTDYLRSQLTGLRPWVVGSPSPPPWYLNPLEVPDGVTMQSHIERLVALFRASFAMVDPLPYVVEHALHEVYEARGWDMARDRGPLAGPSGTPRWPTLSDLLDVAVGLPARLGYPAEVERTLVGAMRARIGSLTRGPKGATLDTDRPLDIDSLLGEAVVVNLDLVGDDEAKAFFMGLLLLRLAEARHGVHSDTLRHLTVIEEAHRLLRRDASTGTAGEMVTSNSTGFVAEAIGNMLAEIRSSGEGIVVVDQSPARLAQSAIANTATKVAFRSTESEDKRVLAGCMNLDDRQSAALTALGRHEAAVWWEGMDRPVLARMERRLPPPAAGAAPYRRKKGTLVAATPQIEAAVRNLVRTHPDESGAARSRLELLVAEQLSIHDSAEVAGAVAHLVRREVQALGRSRGWDAALTDRAVTAVTEGLGTPDHPCVLLVDRSRRYLACEAVCPHGGCLLGEAVQPAAQRVRTDPHVGLRTLLASPEERKRRLRREVLAVLGPDAGGGLQRLGIGCLDAQIFDSLVDPATVNALVEQDRQ